MLAEMLALIHIIRRRHCFGWYARTRSNALQDVTTARPKHKQPMYDNM